MTRWTELREAAEKATLGPWYVYDDVWVAALPLAADRMNVATTDPPTAIAATNFIDVESDLGGVANANFIAAANPSVVLDLIAERDELMGLCEEFVESLEAFKPVMGGYIGPLAAALAHYDQMRGEEA